MVRWLLVAAVGCATVTRGEVPLADPKVYVGAEGARAVVVLLKPLSEDRCLVELSGRGDELDELVMPCRVVRRKDNRLERTDYFVDRRLREYAALTTPGDGSGLVLGRSLAQLRLTFDGAQSRAIDLAAMWNRHQQQLKSGALDRELKFDRAAEVRNDALALKETVARVDAHCGTHLTARLDWTKASDQLFVDRGAQTDCNNVLTAIDFMCGRWKVARTTIAAKITALECVFVPGAEPTLKLAGSVLLVTSGESTNVEFNDVSPFLRNNL